MPSANCSTTTATAKTTFHTKMRRKGVRTRSLVMKSVKLSNPW